MHVLQLGPYPPPEGGINRNMLAIRDELARHGHQCTIIATSRSTAISSDEGVHYPRSPFGLIKLLLTRSYDVLHLHVGGDISRRVLSLILVCGLLGRGRNILSFHSGGYTETAEGKAATARSIRGFIFRRFARVIAVNPALAEIFEQYGVASDKVRVIYPFVHRSPDKGAKIPIPIREFAESSKPFLLTVGLLEDEYDLFMQIDAMEDVLGKLPEAGLMIVGSGSLEERLRAAIESKPYANRIYLAGDVEHKVTLNLIDDCDILLRTTLFDGDAISVREALSLGTSVIATDNKMRPDGVRLIPIGDRKSLVDEIVNIADSETREKHPISGDDGNILAITSLYSEIMSKTDHNAD